MEKIFEDFLPKNLAVEEIPLLSLAFLGDAVHTLIVRKSILEFGLQKIANLHKTAAKLCSANGQSQMLDHVLPQLSDIEADIVRRARNQKTHKPPKSCDLETYKKATSFECLLGWLWAKHQIERAIFLANYAVEKMKESL